MLEVKDTADVLEQVLAEFGDLFVEIVADITKLQSGSKFPSDFELATLFVPKLVKAKAVKKITAIFTGKQPSEVKLTDFFRIVGKVTKIVKESVASYNEEISVD